jgi:zinc transporter ZupT
MMIYQVKKRKEEKREKKRGKKEIGPFLVENMEGWSQLESVLLYAGCSGSAPIIAACIPIFLSQQGVVNPLVLTLMLSASAGLLFAIATLDLIPSALQLANQGDLHHFNQFPMV